MNKLDSNLCNIIIKFLEIKEAFKLQLISKNISNLVLNCQLWSHEIDKYKISDFLKNQYKNNKLILYKVVFNKYCYICKKNNVSHLNSCMYKVCRYCNKNAIHIDSITNKFNSKNISFHNNMIHIDFNKICNKILIYKINCKLYPFYDKNKYIQCKRDIKLYNTISKINTRKNLLQVEFNKFNIKLPLHNNYCKNYILERNQLSKKKVVNEVLKEKYLKECTPYLSLFNYYRFIEHKNKKDANKLALNMIGNPNLDNIRDLWNKY